MTIKRSWRPCSGIRQPIGLFQVVLITLLLGANGIQAAEPSPLLTAPALSTQNAPQAAKEAEAGKEALQSNNAEKALDYFRKAVNLAVIAKNSTDAALYNNEISTILNSMPPWVDEALSKAGTIPANKAGSANLWSKSREKALAAAEKGDLETAIRQGKQAVNLARDNLGAQHSATFMSERELGIYYTLSGKLAEAEPLLRQAATSAKTALGPDHPETLAATKALAELLENQSKLPAAMEIYQASKTAFNAKLGPKHPLAIANDLALARILQNLGRHTEANTLLVESCPIISTTYGYYHPETAKCLEQFAALQMAQEAFPVALVEYEQALSIQQAILPKNDSSMLPIQVGLAEACRRLGNHKKAYEILKPILDAGSTSNDPVITEAKTAMVHLLLDQGDHKGAETLAKQVLKQLTATLGKEHPATIALLVDLAGIHETQGRLAEAESALKEALKLFTATFGETHTTTITTLNNLGNVLEKAGLYDDAEPILRQSLTLAQKNVGPDQPLTLTTMNNLALLHESQGNFDKAEPLYENAISAYGKKLGERHTDTVAVINNLAYLYLLQENYSKAAPLFKKVLEIWTATLGEKHQRTLKAMNNLARVTHHLGQHKEAEKLFTKALALRRQVLGERHMDVLRSMHDLARLYRDMGRSKESEEMLRKTRALDEEVLGPLHPYTFETLNTLASVLEKSKKSEAYQLRKEIFSRRSNFLDRMLWSTGDNAREGYIRLHTPELHEYLAILSHISPSNGGRDALEAGLRRKGLLLKISSEINQIIRLGEDPKIKATSDRLTNARKELAALTLSGPTLETADKHLDTLHKLEREVDELQLKLGQASKRLKHSATNVSIDTLIKHLPDNAALIEFLIFTEEKQPKMLAAILTKEKNKPTFDRAVYQNLEEIQKAILDFRTIIQDENADDEAIKQMGRTVYNLIWDPIQKAIGSRENVYVVPDGQLNILPFPAMVDKENEYLARTTDLHILSSSRDLVPSDIPRAQGKYLIMAGPDYNSDKVGSTQAIHEVQGRRSADLKQGLRAFSSGMRGLHFDPLPGAEKEGKLIAGQATGKKKLNTMLLKNDAQEGALQSLDSPPEILHIATHGFFLKPDDNLRKRLLKLARSAEVNIPPPGDNPLLRAGLAFAGINTNAQYLGEIDTNNDGVLTAMEVLGLNLTGTQLAVLSACETGLGEVHEGEGVYGLRRAFQEAGAKAVISSLWEVSDAGTQALMTNLYARLGEGLPAHKALRESQLDLLESDEWKHPYIWSAFMMVGQ
ncbi:MAG: CHAT domain-containing protein [Magnetococcales bacterium]|nr:CHAT domain-containing protein [Magnetococcales bacterium]